MGRPLKIAKDDNGVLKDLGIPGGTRSVGGVGGNTAVTGSQVQPRVKIGANAEIEGFIIRQKGRSKFLVSDGTNTGTCALANTADGALANDTMTVTFTDDGSSIFRAKRIDTKYVWDFSDNRYIWTHGAANAGPPLLVSVEST